MGRLGRKMQRDARKRIVRDLRRMGYDVVASRDGDLRVVTPPCARCKRKLDAEQVIHTPDGPVCQPCSKGQTKRWQRVLNPWNWGK